MNGQKNVSAPQPPFQPEKRTFARFWRGLLLLAMTWLTMPVFAADDAVSSDAEPEMGAIEIDG